ncbi:MAG: fibronectin type III domain-containing protein [Thermoplasmatota archaeon]
MEGKANSSKYMIFRVLTVIVAFLVMLTTLNVLFTGTAEAGEDEWDVTEDTDDDGLTNGDELEQTMTYRKKMHFSSKEFQEEPDPPVGLENVSEINNYHTITITWENQRDATYYKVYREVEGSYIEIEDSEVTTTYEDDNLNPGREYSYKVKAVNGEGVSGYSEELLASTTKEPSIPVPHLDYEKTNTNKVELEWYVSTAGGSDKIYIYRTEANSDSFSKIDEVPATDWSYIDYPANNPGASRYNYYVKYYDSSREELGDKSNQVTVIIDSDNNGPILNSVEQYQYEDEEFGYDRSTWYIDTPDKNGRLKEVGLTNIRLKSDSDISDQVSVKFVLKNDAGDVVKEYTESISNSDYKDISFDFTPIYPDSFFNEDDYSRFTLEIEGRMGASFPGIVQKGHPEFGFIFCSDYEDEDTDGDGLTDGDEVNEYNTNSLLKDTDSDGVDDYDEVKVFNTDPNKRDTDMDGVSDGVECYHEGTVEYLNGTTKEGGLDPLNPDTDGDGIPDGQEYHGHEFTYFKMSSVDLDGDGSDDKGINPGDPGDIGLYSDGWSDYYDSYQSGTTTDYPSNDSTSGSDSEDTDEIEVPSGESSFIDSMDPLVAYKSLEDSGEREWTDIDGDNIPDAVEQNPDIIGSSRFDDVPWIESIRKFKDEFNDTDDEERQRIFNETFNSHVRYQGKPIVDDLEVDGTYEASWDTGTGADVTIKVYDPSGIDHIYLSSEQESKNVHIDSSDVNDDGLIKKTIHLNTDTSDWVDGWDLDIEVVGESGNVFEETRSIDGVLDSVYDALSKVANYVKNFAEWIWNKVTDAASEAADRAAMLGNMLVDWVKNQVKNTIIPLIQPILDEIEQWRTNVKNELLAAYNEFKNNDDVSSQSIEALRNAFMDDLYYAIYALGAGLLTALMALEGVSFGAGSVAMIVVPFAVGLVAQKLVGHEGGIFEKSISVDTGLDPLLDFLESLLDGSFYEGMDLSTNEGSSLNSEDSVGPIVSFIGALLGPAEFFRTCGALSLGNSYTNLNAIGAAVGSFVASIVGMVFAPAALAADSAGNQETANVLATFAGVFSTLSIGLAAAALAPRGAISALGGIGGAISVITIITSIYGAVT